MRPETIIEAKTAFFVFLAMFFFVSLAIICFLMFGEGDFPGLSTLLSEVTGGSSRSLVQLLPIFIFGLILIGGNLALAFAPRRIGWWRAIIVGLVLSILLSGSMALFAVFILSAWIREPVRNLYSTDAPA